MLAPPRGALLSDSKIYLSAMVKYNIIIANRFPLRSWLESRNLPLIFILFRKFWSFLNTFGDVLFGSSSSSSKSEKPQATKEESTGFKLGLPGCRANVLPLDHGAPWMRYCFKKSVLCDCCAQTKI